MSGAEAMFADLGHFSVRAIQVCLLHYISFISSLELRLWICFTRSSHYLYCLHRLHSHLWCSHVFFWLTWAKLHIWWHTQILLKEYSMILCQVITANILTTYFFQAPYFELKLQRYVLYVLCLILTFLDTEFCEQIAFSGQSLL